MSKGISLRVPDHVGAAMDGEIAEAYGVKGRNAVAKQWIQDGYKNYKIVTKLEQRVRFLEAELAMLRKERNRAKDAES